MQCLASGDSVCDLIVQRPGRAFIEEFTLDDLVVRLVDHLVRAFVDLVRITIGLVSAIAVKPALFPRGLIVTAAILATTIITPSRSGFLVGR